MIIGFSNEGWEDYVYWQKNDNKILKRINDLIKNIKRNSYNKNGLGKPERLKANLSGYYSRRITSKHRLFYTIKEELLIIVQCRYYY
ncbi:Txe/YoeB family addiction module toxin [Nautilia lithotrophica]